MSFEIKKATKTHSRLRLAFIGPSGAGKTYTALAVASHLKRPVCVIDTERGSASKYAATQHDADGNPIDGFDFDVVELDSYSPDNYSKAIEYVCGKGYGTVIVDSLSHAWIGKDGALEQVDRIAKRSQSSNTFAAWRDVTPMHHRLVDTMLNTPCHLIVTMRAKTEYVMEQNDRGKTVPRKIGIAPVQRDGLEYEFDVVGDINLDNELIITKTRCSVLSQKVFQKPGKDVADILNAWLTTGAPMVEQPKAKAPSHPPPAAVSAPNPKIDEAIAIADEDARAMAFQELIQSCAGMPDLLAIGSGISRAKFSATYIESMRGMWQGRKAMLSPSNAGAAA